MKTKMIGKSSKFCLVSVFLGIGLLVVGIAFPSFADVQINNMQNGAMDVDAAIWDRHNGLSDYKIYTYSKLDIGAPHIFCYTIDANGRKSADLKVSLLKDINASIHDANVRNYLVSKFPNIDFPADLTPSVGGKNFFPKIACDPAGTALIVWEYQYRLENLSYNLILGIFVKIDARTGAVTFLDQNEPFVINSFPSININGAVGVYTFAPEVDYVRSKYFCVAYDEYIPSLNSGERLIVKLITSETNPPKVEWNNRTLTIPLKGDVFKEKIPCLWVYATRYYKQWDNVNGNREPMNKSILCNKTPNGFYLEIYVVYNNIGNDPFNEQDRYNSGDTYLIILEVVNDYSGFVHEVFRDAPDEPGFGEGNLNERPNNPPPPDLNTRAVPQLIKNENVKYLEKPLIAVGKNGMVIGLNFKRMFDDKTYYINNVLKDMGRHEFSDIYRQEFLRYQVLRDMELDAGEQNIVLVKQVMDNTISLRMQSPIPMYRYFDLVDLRGVIIPNGENDPIADNHGNKFMFYTGGPAYIHGGKILEDSDLAMKYLYCDKANSLRTARNGIQSGKVYTTPLGIFGGVIADFLGDNASITLQNRLSNGGTTVTFEWDLLDVDVNWLGGGMIFPAYSVYLLLNDGSIIIVANRIDETTAQWFNASHTNYVCAAYVVADLGYGVGVKSNVVLFIVR